MVFLENLLLAIAIGSVFIAILRALIGFSERVLFGFMFNEISSMDLRAPKWVEKAIELLEDVVFGLIVLFFGIFVYQDCGGGALMVLLGIFIGLLAAVFYAAMLWPLLYIVVFVAMLLCMLLLNGFVWACICLV